MADHVPALQLLQLVDDADDHVPAMHVEHREAVVAPIVAEYVPAAHVMQVELDAAGTVDDQVPALQLEHDDPISRYEPAEQNEVHDDAPIAEKDPAAQLLQAITEVAADTDENVPALHCVHESDPNDDHVPALHELHVVTEVEAKTLDQEPALHWMHVVTEVEPATDDHIPALH